MYILILTRCLLPIFSSRLAAFFTIAIMGFTYSIANGICAGFIFYSFMKIVRFIQVRIFFCDTGVLSNYNITELIVLLHRVHGQ